LTETVNLDGMSFALGGPMKIADPARTPVRGDLADIALAGRYFVPHYAVPLERRVTSGGAQLLGASRADAQVLAALEANTDFAVLDVAGGWAWGQCGPCGEQTGLVGYIALDRLVDAA